MTLKEAVLKSLEDINDITNYLAITGFGKSGAFVLNLNIWNSNQHLCLTSADDFQSPVFSNP